LESAFSATGALIDTVGLASIIASAPFAVRSVASGGALEIGPLRFSLSRGVGTATKGISTTDDLFQMMLRKVDELDFSTPRNKAVFYSGPGQYEKAVAFATRTNGMTIEMTEGGKQLLSDPSFQLLSPDQKYKVWEKASGPFASQASGKINAFIEGAKPGGAFRKIEEQALKENINVNRYIYHY
jgi:hypothetical protein